jgi:hypothetical protein
VTCALQCDLCPLFFHRYKAKEIEAMRNKVPLAALQAAVRNAPPARDFKGAILKRAAQTGEPKQGGEGVAAVCVE